MKFVLAILLILSFGAAAQIPLPIVYKYLSGPTLITMPTQTLVLYMTQDYYNGNAQMQISVDGKDMFTTPAQVTARRNLNQRQVFTILGSWTDKPKIIVTFTNDLWGGSATMDRNLYVDGITYNGVWVDTKRHVLGQNGSFTFTPP